jgi:hypothetical protein
MIAVGWHAKRALAAIATEQPVLLPTRFSSKLAVICTYRWPSPRATVVWLSALQEQTRLLKAKRNPVVFIGEVGAVNPLLTVAQASPGN